MGTATGTAVTEGNRAALFTRRAEEYQRRWCGLLTLPGQPSLVESSLWELQQHCPGRTPSEIRTMFDRGGQLFGEQWHRLRVNARSEAEVAAFYNSTDIEIFELMEWHASVEAGKSFGPLNYLITGEVAQACGWGRSYLDFGSGIGSSAIVFAAGGFDVTLADISDPLLAFARSRMNRRGLSATYLDLKVDSLPSDRFDVVTCFDVIEHTVKPLEILKQIRRAMKPGGYLVINNVDDAIAHEDTEHPMHIMHDRHLWRRFRGLGFAVDRWGLPKAWSRISGSSVFVLQKIARPMLTNRLISFYDVRIPDAVKERAKPGRLLRALAGER